MSIGGRTERLTGTGYHDHNWGNVAPRKVLDHWYWGRARVDDYTVVTLNFVSHDNYDNVRLPAVMVAKDGEILTSAVGADRVTFSATDLVEHAETAIPVARRLEYMVRDGDAAFQVTFEHRRDAFTLDLGEPGAYLRFTGDVNLEHHSGGEVATASTQSLWELLYFGARRARSTPPAQPLIGHQA